MNDDEQAIRDLINKWMTATQSGDIQTVLDLMSDDVVFMVPGREPFGKQAFALAWEGSNGARVEGTSDIRELEVLGNWAYLRNFLEVRMTPRGGTTVKRSGYTLTILRKEPDGKWLLVRDANLLAVQS